MNENKLLKIITYIIMGSIWLWWCIIAFSFVHDIQLSSNNSSEIHPLMLQEMQYYQSMQNTWDRDISWEYNSQWWDYQSSKSMTQAQREFGSYKVNIYEENIIEWEKFIPE
jgi:hypothetical protein